MGEGTFPCRTRWDMSLTLPYKPGIGLWPYTRIIKVDNKVDSLSKICVSYITHSFHFISLKSWLFPIKVCVSFRGLRLSNPPPGAKPLDLTGGITSDSQVGSCFRTRHKMVAPFYKNPWSALELAVLPVWSGIKRCIRQC